MTTASQPLKWNADRTSVCGRWRITRHEYVLPHASLGWKLYDGVDLFDEFDTLRKAKEAAAEWNED